MKYWSPHDFFIFTFSHSYKLFSSAYKHVNFTYPTERALLLFFSSNLLSIFSQGFDNCYTNDAFKTSSSLLVFLLANPSGACTCPCTCPSSLIHKFLKEPWETFQMGVLAPRQSSDFFLDSNVRLTNPYDLLMRYCGWSPSFKIIITYLLMASKCIAQICTIFYFLLSNRYLDVW